MQISDKRYRRREYLSPKDEEDLLREINDLLSEDPPAGITPEHPIIFVAGAPRSGTTLLAQAITAHFEVGFMDGLAARFWRAPVTGYRLSQSVFGQDRHSGFRSEYGRAAASDIHSFHYFWMHHLRLNDVADLFARPEDDAVNWPALIGHLAALQAVHGGPFAFKGYYPAYFMEAFCARLPLAVFVIARRNPMAAAESIYKARLDTHGDAGAWFSLQPPGVEALLDLPPEDQIAGQVLGLNRHFDDQIARAGGAVKAIDVSYERFIADPAAALSEIGIEIERLTGIRIPSTGMLPRIRPRSEPRVEPAVSNRLRTALDNAAAVLQVVL